MTILVTDIQSTDEAVEKKYNSYFSDIPFMTAVKRHVTNSSEPSCNDTFLELFEQNIAHRDELSKG
jgi:CRISPR/Cas system CMR-associated protein Cmr5 small subunit